MVIMINNANNQKTFIHFNITSETICHVFFHLFTMFSVTFMLLKFRFILLEYYEI